MTRPGVTPHLLTLIYAWLIQRFELEAQENFSVAAYATLLDNLDMKLICTKFPQTKAVNERVFTNEDWAHSKAIMNVDKATVKIRDRINQLERRNEPLAMLFKGCGRALFEIYVAPRRHKLASPVLKCMTQLYVDSSYK
jgi:hypothetical protein